MPRADSHLVALIARECALMLGYMNPMRYANRACRAIALRTEDRLCTPETPLPVSCRRTYVNQPLGERLTTLFYQTERASLSCTCNSKSGSMLRCAHACEGKTYAVCVPWSFQLNGRFLQTPVVVACGNGRMMLCTRHGLLRFDAARSTFVACGSVDRIMRIGNTLQFVVAK